MVEPLPYPPSAGGGVRLTYRFRVLVPVDRGGGGPGARFWPPLVHKWTTRPEVTAQRIPKELVAATDPAHAPMPPPAHPLILFNVSPGEYSDAVTPLITSNISNCQVEHQHPWPQTASRLPPNPKSASGGDLSPSLGPSQTSCFPQAADLPTKQPTDSRGLTPTPSPSTAPRGPKQRQECGSCRISSPPLTSELVYVLYGSCQ